MAVAIRMVPSQSPNSQGFSDYTPATIGLRPLTFSPELGQKKALCSQRSELTSEPLPSPGRSGLR